MNFLKINFCSTRTILLFTVFIIYSIAVIKADGYHHEDEHYQLIGFAEYRLGHTNEVAWEFKARLRSALQPVICMAIFQLLRSIRIEDPFMLAMVLRAFTALISLSSIWFFAKSRLPELNPKYHIYFLALSFLLWFLPYIDVRFSSESWSGLFLLWALITLSGALKGNDRNANYLFSGLLLGICVVFRFQAILFLLGLISWLLFVEKMPIKKLSYLCTGFLIMMFISVMIDSWFYQDTTIVFYRYIQSNVIHHIALAFGELPWYYILLYILKAPTFMIGIPILISFIVLIVAEPKSLYVWVVTPFILVHLLSPHKELRFLFPLANLVPIIMFTAIQRIRSFQSLKKSKYLIYLVGAVIVPFNCIALAVSISKGAGIGNVEIADYINHHFQHQKVNLIASYQANPFDAHMKFKSNFYKSSNVSITEISSVWVPDFESKIQKGCINLLVLTHSENTGTKTDQKLQKAKFSLVKDVLPQPFRQLMKWYDDWLGDDSIFYGRTDDDQLMLYEYKN